MAEKDTLTTGTPRWVKVSAIIVLLVVGLVVLLVVSGHDVGRHTGAGSVHSHLLASLSLTQIEP